MEKFWEKANEEIYNRGGQSFVTRINEQYPSITDVEYERICNLLTKQAAVGNLTNVSKDEAYYLLAESEYGIDFANLFLSKY